MTQTKKFSQFQGPSQIQSGDIVVGLRDVNGAPVNYQFTGVGSGGGGNGDAIIRTVTADGSAFTVGDWVRVNASGVYVKALADTAEDAEVVGIVVSINGTTSFNVQELGYIAAGTGLITKYGALSAGSVYFLDNAALGNMVLTPPTTNGTIRKALFVAETTDSGWVIQYVGTINGTPAPIPASTGGSDTSIQTITFPNTFVKGDWVYLTGDNTWALADARSLGASQVVGVVIVSGSPTFQIQQSGFCTNVVSQAYDSAGMPVAIVGGTVYYLSDVVGKEGQLTNTAPTGLTSYTKPLFISQNAGAGTGWIFPQRPLSNMDNGDDPSIITVTQNMHNFARGDVVYVDANNHYAKAIANDVLKARAVGFVIEVIDVNTFILQTSGYSTAFSAPFAPLTPAAQYWLSDTTLGGITNIEPSTSGSYTKPMLIALNATTGYILEQRPILAAGVPGGSAWTFLGELNNGNSFSSTTILQDGMGNTFQSYQLIVNTNWSVAPASITATSAGTIGISFQIFSGGAWITALGSYASIMSGVKSVSNVNVPSWWGASYLGGVTPGTDAMIFFPRTSTYVGLASGNATLTRSSQGVSLTYTLMSVDYTGLPLNQTDYVSTGWASCSSANSATGIRLHFINGTLVPGSATKILVYGIPAS